ncbi:MAG: DUF2520 domain-containing protein [Flavobacteriales bacterium]|jgi:predicted short-subunit dehydrogenase-like oxidoreductase (DUF2520 family)|nr:DUF2520 domain-containing protein [Schleiferiaceae bacterium]|tara:strand:- start:12201 stop:12920 length:720 start_codon:yes stop_codon:yes gene_type:complete
MADWVIVGHGQIATALTSRLGACGIPYVQWGARELLTQGLPDMPSNPKGVMLAIPDDHIQAIAQTFSHLACPIIHPSGATSIKALASCKHAAVWWPMQSFMQDDIPWETLNCFADALTDEAARALTFWQNDLGVPVATQANDLDRKKYHLGAVFANNFPNHIVGLYQQVFSALNLPRDAFDQVLQSSVSDALAGNAIDMQTGPARRGDKGTLDAHIDLLPEDLKGIYKSLSDSIQQHDS